MFKVRKLFYVKLSLRIPLVPVPFISEDTFGLLQPPTFHPFHLHRIPSPLQMLSLLPTCPSPVEIHFVGPLCIQKSYLVLRELQEKCQRGGPLFILGLTSLRTTRGSMGMVGRSRRSKNLTLLLALKFVPRIAGQTLFDMWLPSTCS